MTDVTRQVDIAAPPERVWELVSDLPGRGAHSTENTGGRWRGAATGPAVGARFRGSNQAGWKRWSTDATVVRCDPGKSFAISVTSFGLPVAEWSYELEPTAEGTRLRETFADRRGRTITTAGRIVSGVKDRASFNASNIEQSLASLKAAAERT